MRAERYRRARLCEGPIVDRGALVYQKRRMDRLRRWWKAHFGKEYTKATCHICYFCVWDLRFADDHSKEKAPLDQKWWLLHKGNWPTDVTKYYQYYSKELMNPCSVKITPIADPISEDKGELIQQKCVGQKHRCIYCPKIYNNYASLSKHVKTVHPEQKIRCAKQHCRVFFHTQEEKMAHLKKVHQTPVLLKCLYCGKMSTNKANHNNHLQNKHKGQIIRCKIGNCWQLFKTEAERDQHFDEKHNFGQYFCRFCDIYFESSLQQWKHMKKNHKDAPKCPIYNCVDYFKTEEDRHQHIQEKHPVKEGIKCIYCSKFVKTIRRHVKNVHQDIAIKCEVNKCLTFFKSEEEKQKHIKETHDKHSFFCIYCDKMIVSKAGFCTHLQNYHTEEDIIRCDYTKCATFFKTKEEKMVHTKKVHERSVENKFLCIYCNKFTFKSFAKHHMRTMHSEIFIKCTYLCSTYFKTVEDRDKHVREVHEAEKIQEPFPCLYCDKILASFISFKLHAQSQHSDITTKCRFRKCGQHFKSQEDLESHFEQKPKHKEQKSVDNNIKKTVACLLCPKVYKTPSALKRHTKSAHEGVRENKCPHCEIFLSYKSHVVSVLCKICKQKFHCRELLRNHYRNKCKHKCPVCAKICITSNALRDHCTLNHTAHIQQWRGLEHKSLGFKCDECFVYFKTRGSFLGHIRTRHAVFIPTCDFCNRKFIKKYTLQQHIVKNHV